MAIQLKGFHDRRIAFVLLLLFSALTLFILFKPPAALAPHTPRLSIQWPSAEPQSNTGSSSSHELSTTTEEEGSPYAYVFYATDPGYACSALLMIDSLSRLSPHIPTILMVPPGFSPAALKPFAKYHTVILRVNPPQLAPGGNTYYESVLLKLMAFSLHRHFPSLKRVIIMDSDQTVLKPLHHLFDLPSETEVAAPVAYWLPKGITSTLLVISLSDSIWSDVQEGLKTIKKGEYDMDLLNRLFFPKRMTVLPGAYCTLNSHWENSDVPVWQHDQSTGLKGLWAEEAALVHYTAGGKPWGVSMRKLKKKAAQTKADEFFVPMFEMWRKEAGKKCMPGWNEEPWEDLNLESRVIAKEHY